MDRLTRLMLVLMTGLCASVGLAGTAGVTTVSLRATVRLEPDQAATLGAIAEIQGEQRAVLETLALDGVGGQGWMVIEAAQVRALIESSPARYGSVVVEGARVNLMRTSARRAETPAAAAVVPEPAADTLRTHLESWLRTRHGSRAEDIRVAFDERDRAVLGTPMGGRVAAVNPIGSSARPAVRVTVYEGDQIVLSESVRFGIEVLVRAPVLVQPLRRGARVTADAFESRSVWVDPTDMPIDPASAVGQSMRRDLNAGEVLRAGHIEPPLVIRRGDTVSVRTVRGSVVVNSLARARQDAAEGEMVELESRDRSGAKFYARAAGQGRAVMIDGHEDTAAEETP